MIRGRTRARSSIPSSPIPVARSVARTRAWLFVRYTVDKYAAGGTMADWNALTRSLVGTSRTGAQNIATVTGQPFATVVSRWALALYVTDRGGVPSELQYDSWNLHSVYAF